MRNIDKIDTKNCWFLSYDEYDEEQKILIDKSKLDKKNFFDVIRDDLYEIYNNLDHALGWPNKTLYSQDGRLLNFYKIDVDDALIIRFGHTMFKSIGMFIKQKVSWDDAFKTLTILQIEKYDDGKIKRIYNGAFGYQHCYEYKNNAVDIKTYSRMS
jgi:hypothetical protein